MVLREFYACLQLFYYAVQLYIVSIDCNSRNRRTERIERELVFTEKTDYLTKELKAVFMRKKSKRSDIPRYSNLRIMQG